jgi:hypothetical protein
MKKTIVGSGVDYPSPHLASPYFSYLPLFFLSVKGNKITRVEYPSPHIDESNYFGC